MAVKHPGGHPKQRLDIQIQNLGEGPTQDRKWTRIENQVKKMFQEGELDPLCQTKARGL